jgi:oxygen-independent coproporphyrinogen-3 oxidase
MSLASLQPTAAPALASYAYSYPHKSSYRPLSPPVPIADVWRNEDVSRLSLYLHVPFCEMRCGFCNLFTQSQPAEDTVSRYLATLVRQMRVVRSLVPAAQFAQLALGGGTPTFLAARQLESLLRHAGDFAGLPLRGLATSVETSPATATADRLQVLAEHDVHRISLGVQSFVPDETRQFGRPQRAAEVHEALERIRACGFPALNIDLIYGDPCQTRESWLESVRAALRYRPEELYLYPLYVRPQTGLANAGKPSAALRDDLYRAARELLGEQGYIQSSLRSFRLPEAECPGSHVCQRDGMIGLGCGARSYSRQLHYATRFAVAQAGVRAILAEWIAQSDAELALATHGIWLSDDEQRRRFVILTLLQAEGLSLAEFDERFPASSPDELSGIDEIVARGWAIRTGGRLRLTRDGLEQSDVIGPLLYSEPVRERLREFLRLPDGGEERMRP